MPFYLQKKKIQTPRRLSLQLPQGFLLLWMGALPFEGTGNVSRDLRNVSTLGLVAVVVGYVADGDRGAVRCRVLEGTLHCLGLGGLQGAGRLSGDSVSGFEGMLVRTVRTDVEHLAQNWDVDVVRDGRRGCDCHEAECEYLEQ